MINKWVWHLKYYCHQVGQPSSTSTSNLIICDNHSTPNLYPSAYLPDVTPELDDNRIFRAPLSINHCVNWIPNSPSPPRMMKLFFGWQYARRVAVNETGSPPCDSFSWTCCMKHNNTIRHLIYMADPVSALMTG